jgi:acetyltransferase-like isoleucine patch superfamily enzyme
VEVQTESQVILGEGISIQRRSTINGSVRLGNGCILAPNVFISSGTHPFRFIPHLPIREQERRMANNELERSALDRPVWVQDDCWLGANVVVCPGVTIGKGSIVGANTVVTKDVHPYSVVVGNPGGIKGSRLDWRPPACIDPSREEDRPYLLDGRLRTDSRGSYIQVAEGSAVLAVLMAPGSSGGFEIAWRASQAVTIIVGKRRESLPFGQGLLSLSVNDLQIESGVTQCAIAIASDSARGGKLDIIRLGWKPH